MTIDQHEVDIITGAASFSALIWLYGYRHRTNHPTFESAMERAKGSEKAMIYAIRHPHDALICTSTKPHVWTLVKFKQLENPMSKYFNGDKYLGSVGDDEAKVDLKELTGVELVAEHNKLNPDKPLKKFLNAATGIKRIGALVGEKKARRGRKPAVNLDKKIQALVENPKRAGSASHKVFGLYSKEPTVREFITNGGSIGHVNYDLEHKYIKLV